MLRAWLLLFALAACRIWFDEVPRDGATDGASDARNCAEDLVDLGPWSTPVRLTALETNAAEDDPTPRDDGLELLFTSDRAGSLGESDIWRSTRATTGDPWGPAEHVIELSSAQNENTPALSRDGRTIWFASGRPGGLGGEDIWTSTRATLDSPWTTPVLVPELSGAFLERGVSLFADDLALAMHSEAAGSQDIYVATRASQTSSWSTPVLLGAPNTPATELRPWVSPCGLEMYFQSGARSGGDMNFLRVTRASVDEPFGNEMLVDELNSTAYDQDLRITPDRRRAYFSSVRGDNDGNLWESTR